MDIDSTYLHQIRTDSRYDYISEINSIASNHDQDHLYSSDYSTDIIDKIIRFVDNNTETLGYISITLLSVLVIYIIYRLITRYMLFGSDDEKAKSMGTDTIEGHRWDEELQALMDRGEYGEVVVLYYLKWLETLNRQGIIQFSTSKTPGMFLNEVADYTSDTDTSEERKTRIELSQRLTNHYLRIRYGHRAASAKLARELMAEMTQTQLNAHE